jgi:5'-3' exonuclease
MGIPYYVASILKKHKNVQGTTPVTAHVVAIDFNCFIHRYLKPENPIGSIVVALYHLLETTVHASRVYIAFDGLVPMAKMVQQRYRRFRIPDSASLFDKHQISPGTPFMCELADTLRLMFPNAEISDTSEPGEGEHKMFRWFRTLPANQNICIYGLDADLVLISIAQSHLGNIQILREQENDEYSVIRVNALVSVLPMEKDAYVKTSLLSFGNDFMPNLAMFSLREDGYARAMYYADKPSPTKDEKAMLMKRVKDSDRRLVSVDGHAIEQRVGVHLMDGVIDWEPVVHAFWKTYAWTYHYFTTSEVLDWMWVYPYPEAPLLTTLDEYEKDSSFVWSHPTPCFTIEDQLQFILPETSLRAAGRQPRYPDEMYNEETDTRHPWMRRFKWECDPYISLPSSQLTAVSEYHLPSTGGDRGVVLRA